MPSRIKNKRSLTNGFTPPAAQPNDVGTFLVGAHEAQQQVWIGTGTAGNEAWLELTNQSGSGQNVSAAIPAGAGTSVEDDINEFDFNAYGGPLDSTATSEALIEAGTNLYLICARDGATYLYSGPIPRTIGNESAPFDGSAPGAPAPTDAAHHNVVTADLVPFGGNPDALVQNPPAGTSQVINSAAVGDVPLSLVGFAGQTADLLQFEDSTNTVLSRFQDDGTLQIGDVNPGSGAGTNGVQADSAGFLTARRETIGRFDTNRAGIAAARAETFAVGIKGVEITGVAAMTVPMLDIIGNADGSGTVDIGRVGQVMTVNHVGTLTGADADTAGQQLIIDEAVIDGGVV